MPSDEPGGYETIWAPEQVALTIAMGLPGIVLTSAVTGLLATIFTPPGAALAVGAAVAVAIVAGRILTWGLVTGRRVVAVSRTHLAVRSGSRTVREMPWDAIASVALVRGDSLLQLTVDITAHDTTFPQVRFKPVDVWDVREGLPAVLAILPSELRRLEIALRGACAAQSLPFTLDC